MWEDRLWIIFQATFYNKTSTIGISVHLFYFRFHFSTIFKWFISFHNFILSLLHLFFFFFIFFTFAQPAQPLPFTLFYPSHISSSSSSSGKSSNCSCFCWMEYVKKKLFHTHPLEYNFHILSCRQWFAKITLLKAFHACTTTT